MSASDERLWASSARITCERFACTGPGLFGALVALGTKDGWDAVKPPAHVHAAGIRYDLLSPANLAEIAASGLAASLRCECGMAHYDPLKRVVVKKEHP